MWSLLAAAALTVSIQHADTKPDPLAAAFMAALVNHLGHASEITLTVATAHPHFEVFVISTPITVDGVVKASAVSVSILRIDGAAEPRYLAGSVFALPAGDVDKGAVTASERVRTVLAAFRDTPAR